MPFYVLKRQSGEYLALLGNQWVSDLREAAVFTSRSNASNAIRRAWQDECVIERIVRLPIVFRALRDMCRVRRR